MSVGSGAKPQASISTRHDEAMTSFSTDHDMGHLEQSKTCDGGCCEHDRGCKCNKCFCEVRTDIPTNANQTTYSGEGGRGVPIAYGELSTGANYVGGVEAMAANFESLRTDASSSIPIDIAHREYRPDSLIAPPSFDALRERDAHQSYEEHFHVNIHRYMSSIRADDNISEMEHPSRELISPAPLRSDCELMFEFDSSDLGRVNSHELPPDTLSLGPHSSRNASAALRGAGGLFDTTSITNRSQYSLDMSLCFYPLVVVPECRHAAQCA